MVSRAVPPRSRCCISGYGRLGLSVRSPGSTETALMTLQWASHRTSVCRGVARLGHAERRNGGTIGWTSDLRTCGTTSHFDGSPAAQIDCSLQAGVAVVGVGWQTARHANSLATNACKVLAHVALALSAARSRAGWPTVGRNLVLRVRLQHA
jgi:hypothetical protein